MCFDKLRWERKMNPLTLLRLWKAAPSYCFYSEKKAEKGEGLGGGGVVKKSCIAAFSFGVVLFPHNTIFPFSCDEINIQVRQCNKLLYNLHLRKRKISNSVTTVILNTKYRQIITWLHLSFCLHYRYRDKQCNIQTSKFTAISTSF